ACPSARRCTMPARANSAPDGPRPPHAPPLLLPPDLSVSPPRIHDSAVLYALRRTPVRGVPLRTGTGTRSMPTCTLALQRTALPRFRGATAGTLLSYRSGSGISGSTRRTGVSTPCAHRRPAPRSGGETIEVHSSLFSLLSLEGGLFRSARRSKM